MNINNLSFPYPVLGIGNDIEPRPGFASQPTVEKKHSSFIFETDLEMKNKDIARHIKYGHAKYVCEVACSPTMLRRCFFSDTPHFSIELPKHLLNEKVTFQFSVVVTKPIRKYSNQDFHEDYVGYTFDLDPGDLLAFIGQFAYDVDIKYDKLKSVGSFMQITEGKLDRMPNFILGGDKIEIRLPSPMYEQYRSSILGNQQFSHIIHSSLVFNALVMALLYMEENKTTLWARTLCYRIETESALAKFKEHLFELEQEDVMELAQILLLDPYKRLFNSLSGLIETEDD